MGLCLFHIIVIYTPNVPCFPGLGNDDLAERMGQLELFEPDTKEDFDKFGNLLRDKITKYDVSYLSVSEYIYHSYYGG